MSKIKTSNPLFGVTIGSIISSKEGEFKGSVVSNPINSMISQQESYKSMTGKSSYVYSDEMNQGVLGVSGSYGVSGVSKLKSSVSAYIGESSAVSSKSVSVNYNAISIGGIEYINFEELTASEFLASLKLGCQQSLLSVLDSYNAIIAETSNLDVELEHALTSDDYKYKGLKELVSEWIEKSEKFTYEYEDGIVVGITWGAYGGVKMLMTSSSEADSWKYGGQANFSYVNPFTSVAVKATYDGSQSSSGAKVDVNCTSYVSGAILSPQIDKWFDQVENKSFSELAEIKVMDKAPDMKISEGAPEIPDFEKPEPSDDIVSKVGEIKDLNGLKALAMASAFDKAQKTNPKLTLDEFLRESEKPANTKELSSFRKVIQENKIDTLTFPLDKESKPKSSLVRKNLRQEQKSDSSGYVPLGVWVANWADIFPWMAQGYYNSIDNIEGQKAVRERVMLQDYQTLSKLYYIANSSGIVEFRRKDSLLPRVRSLDIADAFANAAANMQNNLGDTETIKEIYETLGPVAKDIYVLWNEIAFLRNCELGMGLIKNNKTIGNPSEKDGDRQKYKLNSCDFDGKNHVAFSRFYKVLPLITPDKDIWAFGPEMGGLSSVFDSEAIFSKPGRIKYISFEYDVEEKILFSDNDIKLYPIPFSASENVPWKGMSVSTNIKSMSGFNKNLKVLNEQLDKLKAWTFSSDNWDKNWSGKDAYQQKNIKKQYVGLIEEPKNVF
ncbi:hypothetical protein [Aquimarina mytili]|uniref:MACPF domain-containing protein n=1 Tax=Aquimarina mytili TaxID=874423 RepID=A0A937DCV1_9FLAO|nr:hypothetical protein [Aquimarina mytili]MBL0685346.1 hypothetical protein [Aquimarina mytili]